MEWCIVCCTQHAPRERCPGPLEASGEEFEVRRYKVFTGHVEYIGIFIAPVDDRFRARIATLPRMLWCVPGRRDTIKFVGDTKEAAAALAIEFVQRHCSSRGHRILDRDAPLHAFGKIGEPEVHARPLDLKDPRVPHAVPALFGTDKIDRPAKTLNLSSGGLFLATDRPLPTGCEIRIVLDARPYEIPLHGKVAWVRKEHAADRPAVIGVQLHAPPPAYTRYVRALLERERGTRGEAGGGPS